jgi:sec-independent protein translocase protein TatA
MGGLRPWHIAVLVIVLLLLFGAKRLPDGARGLGRALRIFKAETKGLMEDDVRTKAEAQSSRSSLADDDDSVRARGTAADEAREPRQPVVESRVIDADASHERAREKR